MNADRVPLRIPPGLTLADTSFAASGNGRDGNNIRFVREDPKVGAKPEVIGGWERLTTTTLGGVCRNVFPWTDNNGGLNVSFGTHATLEVWTGGGHYDITPAFSRPPESLGSNPLTVTNGSPTVEVDHAGHGLATGDEVEVSGAVAVGGITPNGTFEITVTDDDTYTFDFSSNASASTTGGGSAIVIQPQNAFVVGSENGTGGAGYGTGTWDTGAYSEPSTADYFPRTWSFGAYGESLIASARGGTLYWWQNDSAVAAAPILNAPRKAAFIMVSPQLQVIAFGCNEEASGDYNPLCIRHSSIRDPEDWTTLPTNTAREYVLQGGGRLVGGVWLGETPAIWTDSALYIGTFIGAPEQVWRWDRIAVNCGLIGPNAAIAYGQAAVWLTPSGAFYRYVLGGVPEPVACSLSTELDNLATVQQDKIVAATVSAFSECWFFYPDSRDGEGLENSRAIFVGLDNGGAWSKSDLERTAFIDAQPAQFPIGCDPDGNVYWHERGYTADGGRFAWSYETADQYLGQADELFQVQGLKPDFRDQVGNVQVTIYTRMEPQDDEREAGPYTAAPGALKVDFTTTGRLARVKFQGEAGPVRCRFGEPQFLVKKRGSR